MQELAKTVNDKATKRIAIAPKCSINRLKTDNNVNDKLSYFLQQEC